MTESLDDVFNELYAILDSSYREANPDLWRVYFHWWKVYHALNEKIKLSSPLSERIAIIDKFVEFHNKICKISDSLIDSQGLTEEEVPEIDLDSPTMPQNLKDIIMVMRHERAEFGKHLRKIKRLKVKEENRGRKSS